MKYKQLVSPNLSISGRIGYCLEYIENVCGAPHLEPSAYVAGQNTQFKHYDADFPTDVISIQWYEYWLDGVRLDHVTLYVPGEGFYSSPWQQGTTHAVLPSIAEVERIYGVKYLFWSEDISTLRVIEGDDMSTVGEVEFHDLYEAFFGPMSVNPPTDGDRKRWIGSETNTVLRGMQDDPRHGAWLQYIEDLKKAESTPAPAPTPEVTPPPATSVPTETAPKSTLWQRIIKALIG